MHRTKHPEIPIEHVELREEAYGLGYVLSVNDNDNLLFPDPEDNPAPVVEVWVDRAITGGPEDARPALANIRLTRSDALLLAEQIIIAAERLPIEKKEA